MIENKQIPDFLSEMLIKQYGENETKQIIEGYGAKRIVSFRVNTLKSNILKIESKLKELEIEFEKVNWYPEAFIIPNKDDQKKIEALDIYENGEIYFQSLSSMLPPLILDPKEKENILDMAAAPGGKTTQIATLTNNKSYITACEMNAIRAERLKYNIEKQGVTSAYVMQVDSRNLDDAFSFDKILLDAPCSGSGTLNLYDSKMEKYFTLKLVQKSSKAQITLLKKALKCLKTGGEMIYSTCSLLACENEEIVKKALLGVKAEIVPIKFDGIEELQTLPVKIEGTLCVKPTEMFEGFYIAKIRKKP